MPAASAAEHWGSSFDYATKSRISETVMDAAGSSAAGSGTAAAAGEVSSPVLSDEQVHPDQAFCNASVCVMHALAMNTPALCDAVMSSLALIFTRCRIWHRSDVNHKPIM